MPANKSPAKAQSKRDGAKPEKKAVPVTINPDKCTKIGPFVHCEATSELGVHSIQLTPEQHEQLTKMLA